MSRKGVSLDEKKQRMLQLFHEKGECFQLKELEKIAPKEKGIIANSVKDVIQKLLDDGLIETDKIGGSVYFWSFPSKALTTKKRKLEDLKSNHESLSKKFKIAERAVQKTDVTEEEAAKRDKIVDEINDVEIELISVKKKLQECQENDPALVQGYINKTQKLKEAANRWTDNIFELKSWCKKKFFIEDSTLKKQFGIPEDLDYLE